MVKVRKNRIPRDWSKVTKERNFTSSVNGMKEFLASKDKAEAEILKVKAHRDKIRKEIDALTDKAGQAYNSLSEESRNRHAEIEAKILRKKRLLSMFDTKVRMLDSKINVADKRAFKLKQKMSQKIEIVIAKEEAEKAKKKALKLTQEQKNELYRVFPENKKVRVETVGGRRRVKVVSKKPFSLS